MQLTEEQIRSIWDETAARISEVPFYTRFANALLTAHNAEATTNIEAKPDYLGGCMGPSNDDGLGGCMG